MDQNKVKILNYETFANPYFWFWGLRLPLLFVEQAVKTHPMVSDCFVHIHQDSDVNPEITLIVELSDYQAAKSKLEISEDFFVVKGPVNFYREIRDVIKKNSSDFIELHEVIFIFFIKS